MNKSLSGIIASLLVFPLYAVAEPSINDTITEPQSLPANAKPTPATSDESKTTNKATQKTADKTATAKTAAPVKPLEPINGAFGIPLGKPFKTSMVAKVISRKEQLYSGPGGKKLNGHLLSIVPGKPDKRFQQYSLKTTDKGVIYAIQGDYQYKVKEDKSSPAAKQLEKVKAPESKPKGKGKGAGKPGKKKQSKTKAMQKTCKTAVKTLAKELQALYGKPRGQGWDGLWFVFRQFSDTSNRGLKLYGHRCRTGMYSIIYTDDKVQRGIIPVKAKVPAKDKDKDKGAEKPAAKPAAKKSPDSPAAEPVAAKAK